MKKYIAGFSISAGLLVAGCSAEDDSAQVDSTNEEIQEETQPTESTSEQTEQQEQQLESPYQEIKEYFDAWELPEGGKEDTEMVNGITYDNGYTFDKNTKVLIARLHPAEGEPAEPTEDQKVGVIMGWLQDAAAIPEPEYRAKGNAAGQVANPLFRLSEAKQLNDFAPLDEWISETEEIFAGFDDIETEQERAAVYAEGYERLEKMSSLIQNDIN